MKNSKPWISLQKLAVRSFFYLEINTTIRSESASGRFCTLFRKELLESGSAVELTTWHHVSMSQFRLFLDEIASAATASSHTFKKKTIILIWRETVSVDWKIWKNKGSHSIQLTTRETSKCSYKNLHLWHLARDVFRSATVHDQLFAIQIYSFSGLDLHQMGNTSGKQIHPKENTLFVRNTIFDLFFSNRAEFVWYFSDNLVEKGKNLRRVDW
jgi:hypothetical protein